jgi:hypothetical protein
MTSEGRDGGLEYLLPGYINDRLTPELRRQVDAWLDSNPQARQQLRSWRQIHTALQGRPVRTPPSRIWLTLERRIFYADTRRGRSAASLLAGIALTVITLVLLWLTIRPGVLLEWTVSGDSLVAYRVYRAQADSHKFVLLGEIDSKPGEIRYTYLDVLSLPGQRYVYQVEGVTASGVSIVSQRVASQPLTALPGQLAILISSLVLGVLAAILVRNWDTASLPRLLPT